MLLGVFMHHFLYGHIFSPPVGIYLRVDLLGHTGTYVQLRNCQTVFHMAVDIYVCFAAYQ